MKHYFFHTLYRSSTNPLNDSANKCGTLLPIDTDMKTTRLKLLTAAIASTLYFPPVMAQDAAIPSYITDDSIFELEGDNPVPLINETTLEFLPLESQFVTSNGNGWRHEYKVYEEQRLPMQATFDLFKATYTVSMSDGAKSIINQFHGDGPTLMKLYYSDSEENFVDDLGNAVGDSIGANGVFDLYARLRTKDLPDFGEDVFHFGTFVAGDTFDVTVENNYGVVTVTVNDLSITRELEQTLADYFKFGNYLQAQVTTDETHPFGGLKCSELVPPLGTEECYEFLGVSESSVTLTDVSYERIEDPDYVFPAPDANAELLNGDFEDSLNNWIENEPVSGSGDTFSGTGSAKVGAEPGRVYQRVEVMPNTEYELSAYVKGEGAIGIKGTERIDDVATSEPDLVENFDTTEWTQVAITFVTGADPLPVYVYGLHGTRGEDVRFDDFSLSFERGPVAGNTFCPSANGAPGGSFDLTNWRIQTADAEGTNYPSSELAELNNEFFCLADDGGMVLYAPVDGGTGGLTYPRSELTEVFNLEDSSAGWVANGTHTVSASGAVTLAPSNGKIVIAQVESLSDDTVAKMLWDNDRVRVQLRQIEADGTPGSYEDYWFAEQDTSFPVGTPFEWEMAVEDGVLSVTVNGETTSSDFGMLSTVPSAYADDEFYFAVGSQPQDNELDSAGEAGEVLFYSLDVDHVDVSVTISSCPSGFGPPASAFDLSDWRIKVPDEDGTIYTADELATLSNEFFCLSDDGAMAMYAPVAGGTGGSTYPRTELTELLDSSDSNFGWDASGTHSMSAAVTVTQSPSNGKIVIAQVDSSSDDILAKIQWDNDRIRVQLRQIEEDGSPGSYDDYWFAGQASSFPVGTSFDWDMSIEAGVLTVTVDGEAVVHDFAMLSTTPSDYADDRFYFTAGSQPQDNTQESPGGIVEAGEVLFYSFDVAHSDDGTEPPVSELNLRHSVYSGTAAEVFWDRYEGNGPVRYEVSRDGEVLGLLDALSYFDDTLTPGETYTYTVRVVGDAVNETVTDSTTLTTNDGGSGGGGDDGSGGGGDGGSDGGGDGGSGGGNDDGFPTGIRATVYSSTAAELFWDRPAESGVIYEISRDGVVIAMTQGISFFDNTLSPGTSYEYRVVAIFSDGTRSDDFAQASLSTNAI